MAPHLVAENVGIRLCERWLKVKRQYLVRVELQRRADLDDKDCRAYSTSQNLRDSQILAPRSGFRARRTS